MSTKPDAIQWLNGAVNIASNRLNTSQISEEEFRSYIKTVVCQSFLPQAMAQIVAPIKQRHVVSEKDFKLVHYTSVDKLVKILQSERDGYMRLYDSAHFNDPDEGRYLTRNWHKEGNVWLSSEIEGHAYITSFIFVESENARDLHDDLVFWRTYGRDGHGCSITIPAARFAGNSIPLLRVSYGRSKAQRTLDMLEASFLDIRNVLDSVRDILDKDSCQGIKKIIADEFEAICYLYKSHAYRYERECRFVVTEREIDAPAYEYISSDSYHEDVRQYYEDEMLSAKNILGSSTTITLGPSVKNADRIKSYLCYLLKEADINGTTIQKSRITYRG